MSIAQLADNNDGISTLSSDNPISSSSPFFLMVLFYSESAEMGAICSDMYD
jgi:hypothetical protein